MKKEQIRILRSISDGRLSVDEGLSEINELFYRAVSNIKFDVGTVDKDLFEINKDDLINSSWDFAHKWIEELRKEKHQWANAYYNLKKTLLDEIS